jgi:hypothetical protein
MYNQKNEKDLEIKLRYMRLLWKMGYFTRKNIPVSQIDSLGANNKDFTDIDVLGIIFDNELNWHMVIADCKSGYAKNAERLFWISGVKRAVKANKAFFIRKQLDEIKYTELAQKLELTPLTIDQLLKLESTYKVNDALYFGPFCTEKDIGLPYINSLKKVDKRIENYILKGYWISNTTEQIVTLISCCHQIIDFHLLDEKTRSFSLSYIYSLLAISLLKFSQSVFYISESNKPIVIEQNLMGGFSQYIQRIKLVSSFYEFLVNEILVRYKERYPVSEEQFVKGITPEYIKYASDLVSRICDNPKAAKYLPQLLDLFTYEFLESETDLTDDFIEINKDDYGNIISIFKNFVSFTDRACILTPTLRDKFKIFFNKYNNGLYDTR